MAAISMHSPRMPTERRVYTCTQPPTGERMQNPLGSNGLVATPAATSVSPRSLRPRNGRGPSLAGGRRSVTRAASHVQRGLVAARVFAPGRCGTLWRSNRCLPWWGRLYHE